MQIRPVGLGTGAIVLATALAFSISCETRAQQAARELTVFSGGAVKSGLSAIVGDYEKSAGTKAAIEYMPMGALTKKLQEGGTADVVVLTSEVMAEAEKNGWVEPKSVVEVGRVGMGVAVHASAPSPDISTPDAFRNALLAAKSIVYIDPARGTSGKAFAQIIEQLGIAREVNAKAKLLDGGYVVEPVGRGEIELGVHQITEILPVKGVKLVGPLPEPLQRVTIYAGAVTARARDADAARHFLAYLQSPAVRTAFASRGFTSAK